MHVHEFVESNLKLDNRYSYGTIQTNYTLLRLSHIATVSHVQGIISCGTILKQSRAQLTYNFFVSIIYIIYICVYIYGT